MNAGTEQQPTPMSDNNEDVQSSALQQAIRQRSIDTLNAEQARPPASLARRLLIIGLTGIAILVFVVMINFVVTGMHKIMDVWYPGSISGATAQPVPAEPPPLGPDQPFYISVDPPLAQPTHDHATGANSSASSDAHR
jgi:hypothetical protein